MTSDAQSTPPGLAALAQVWFKIGLMSFGGPAAQIALMHRETVETRGWISERDYLNATGFCMLLPGPEAMQIATYVGWRLGGVPGGLIAGGLFVLPGALVIFALAAAYMTYGDIPLVAALFLGVQAAVIALVLKALIGLMGRALNGPLYWGLALFGFLALFVFALPFPVVIATAALLGAGLASGTAPPPHSAPTGAEGHGTLRTVLTWAAIWMAPLAVLWLLAPDGMLLQIGLFFSWLAVVTFGGAYAVLAYMAQLVVTEYGWLSAAQMMDGLGLAETTPGPLILVTQFVGFVAGAEAGGLTLALAAATLTLWVTFAPCFLWIFAAAPYVDRIAAQPRLQGALQGITASVVGVIANLSLWFALHVLFGDVSQADWGLARPWVPDLATVSLPALGLCALACAALFGRNLALHWVLLMCAGGAGLLHAAGMI